MKVLMYGWEFPPRISGGLGVACYSIVKALAEKHVNVTVVLPETVENTLNENVNIIGCEEFYSSEINTDCWQKLFNFDIARVNFKTILHPYITEQEYINTINNSCCKKSAKDTVRNISRKAASSAQENRTNSTVQLSGKYGTNLFIEVLQYATLAGSMAETVEHDVIHVHDWLTVLAGVVAKQHSHRPLIFHVHALEYDRSGDNVDTRIFAIEKYGMEQADKIVAVSEYTKNVIVAKYGISPNKIEVIYNATDVPEDVSLKPQKHHHYKMVLFLGRMAHQKGPHHFVSVAKKILKRRKDIHFVIAGTGGLLPELILRVAKLRLGKYIHFTGFLDKKRVEKLFRLADVYVMPSVSEPFGISCLEALSHDVPVVISKQSGAAEVLNHVFKVDFWDIDEMANKIIAILDHAPLKTESLKHAAHEVKHLTWEKAATSIIKLYHKLIGDHHE